jgi:omega-hydroxy-beta-dihydromenaquinone-9 sulfotransferase
MKKQHGGSGPDNAAPFRDPIFIIGTGRCGSTLVHDLLTRHPEISFLNRYANQHPTHPAYNKVSVACFDLPGAAPLARRKWFPVEAYRFWDHYFRGFSRPFRDLTAADVYPSTGPKLRAATQAFATARRPQLICKITGWPRIGFLQAIYPNAKFISVIRDGCATASSLLHVHFWDGWQGPDKWSWGPLSAERNQRWQSYDRSFVALAGLQWEILMEAYEQAKNTMSQPERLLEIRYEELCAEPMSVLRRAAEFAEVEFCARFQDSVRTVQLHDTTDKWRRDLKPAQQSVLTDCLKASLEHWGYEPASSNTPRLAAEARIQQRIEPCESSVRLVS